LEITPQRVLFNDEDFHSVEILETVVRQSGVLVHRKKCLFCKVTPVSIQTFVEGLLRPVSSPENITKYFALLIARVQMLFTFLSVPFVKIIPSYLNSEMREFKIFNTSHLDT
jgi:hypothetical protein